MWRPLLEAGVDVRVILDSPLPARSAQECIATRQDRTVECHDAPQDVRSRDPVLEAAEGVDGVSVVDLSSHFCRDGSCPYVIGDVLVYRDNHISDSFASSLAEPIRRSVLGY